MTTGRGYTRGRVLSAGAGAAELWKALLDGLDGPGTAGAVGPVYDRSAYLELGAVGADDRLGPPLVLLAPPTIEGPLATAVAVDGPGGLPLAGLEPGARVRAWPAAGRGPDRRSVTVRVGSTLDLHLDQGRLEPSTPPDRRYGDVRTFGRGGAAWRRALDALDVLVEDGAEDGLGQLDQVRALAEGRSLPGDLAALADGWAAVVAETDHRPAPPTDLLGRGPGATPAGDDLLAGLVLALLRTTDGDDTDRVRAAGEPLVEAAGDRTTSVSTALLAQAVRGRAAPRVEAALRGLLAPAVPRTEWTGAVLDAAELGHTSGIDTLLGALLVPLGVGPRLAGRA